MVVKNGTTTPIIRLKAKYRLKNLLENSIDSGTVGHQFTLEITLERKVQFLLCKALFSSDSHRIYASWVW